MQLRYEDHVRSSFSPLKFYIDTESRARLIRLIISDAIELNSDGLKICFTIALLQNIK